MFYDGLQSPWDGQSMGCFAEATASKYGYGRSDQDAFASESVRRARQAIEAGAFRDEIAPVTISGRKGDEIIDRDETPFTLDISRIPTLKPAFRKDGTVTAASSSSISDGAAALVIAGATAATERGLRPLARIVAYAAMRRNRNGSRPRPRRRSARRSIAPAGRSRMSTCSRSTRPSRA
jgi:acetyl-CoA C-acetyltransferase